MEGNTMADMGVKITFDVNRLVEYLGSAIKSGIDAAGKKQAEKRQLQKTANALFKAAAKEIYNNLAILGEQNPKDLKTLAINAPQIKTIVQSLETTAQEQCEPYIQQYTRLTKKEKAKIIDQISLAQFKINQLRRLTQKTKKELETSAHTYRPAVRLQNIRAVYLNIIDKLK